MGCIRYATDLESRKEENTVRWWFIMLLHYDPARPDPEA